MRLFLAIELEEAPRHALMDAIHALKTQCRGRWTRRENLHLTLEFLGELPDARDVVQTMDAISAPPFELTLTGLGRFRQKGGDLIWYGVTFSPALMDLQHKLHAELKERGFRLEHRPYKPHLTLGRQVAGAGELSGYPAPRITQRVTAYSLMESRRVDGRLTYTVLYRRRLEGQERRESI